MMQKNILKFKILFIVFLFSITSIAVFASENNSSYTYVAPTPSEISLDNPASFIESLYTWGIGIVGILALIQLIRSGIMYMVSGAVDKKSAAKEHITNALIGLGLALASYLILNIINPTLLELKNPELKTNFGTEKQALPGEIQQISDIASTTCNATNKEALFATGDYIGCTESINNGQTCWTCAKKPSPTQQTSSICGNNNCNACGSSYCGQNISGYDATNCKWDTLNNKCVNK